MAAGNDNKDIDDPSLGNQIAQLSTLSDVITVGAISHKSKSVDGLDNIMTYFPGRDTQGPYTNFGPKLVLMGPTDSPAVDGTGEVKWTPLSRPKNAFY